MKIRATTSIGNLKAGEEYDLPDNEAQAAIVAGHAIPVFVGAQNSEPANKQTAVHNQSRWLTR